MSAVALTFGRANWRGSGTTGRDPFRLDILAIPAVPIAGKFLDLGGFLFGEVRFLAEVLAEVVELGALHIGLGTTFDARHANAAYALDQFPVALADRHLRPKTPVESFMRCSVSFAE